MFKDGFVEDTGVVRGRGVGRERDEHNIRLERYQKGRQKRVKLFAECKKCKEWFDRDDLLAIKVIAYKSIYTQDAETTKIRVCLGCQNDIMQEIREELGWENELYTASELADMGISLDGYDGSEAEMREEGVDFSDQHLG